MGKNPMEWHFLLGKSHDQHDFWLGQSQSQVDGAVLVAFLPLSLE